MISLAINFTFLRQSQRAEKRQAGEMGVRGLVNQSKILGAIKMEERKGEAAQGDFVRDSGCVASSSLQPLSVKDIGHPGAIFLLRLLGGCFRTISMAGNRDWH